MPNPIHNTGIQIRIQTLKLSQANNLKFKCKLQGGKKHFKAFQAFLMKYVLYRFQKTGQKPKKREGKKEDILCFKSRVFSL
jgi:hypothetical protein